jgi:hypothetical protein
MGVVSETGRRRVSASTATAIVLLCGAVGFVLGSVYPPEVLFSRGKVQAINSPTAATGPAERAPSLPVATPIPDAAEAAGRSAATTPAPAPTEEATAAPTPPSSPSQPTILNKAAPDPAPAPEKVPPAQTPAPQNAAVDEIRPNSRALAVVGEKSAKEPEEKSAEPAQHTAKEIKKADRKSGERRRAASSERAARPKRQQYAAPATQPAPAQPKGVISQIPIVGPVVGLVLPF